MGAVDRDSAGLIDALPDLMKALERTLANVRSGERPRAEPADEGDGKGARTELAELDRYQLYERAQRAEIRGRSKMTKKQLVDALADD